MHVRFLFANLHVESFCLYFWLIHQDKIHPFDLTGAWPPQSAAPPQAVPPPAGFIRSVDINSLKLNKEC